MNHEEGEQFPAVLEMVKMIKNSNDSIGRDVGVRSDEKIEIRVLEERMRCCKKW